MEPGDGVEKCEQVEGRLEEGRLECGDMTEGIQMAWDENSIQREKLRQMERTTSQPNTFQQIHADLVLKGRERKGKKFRIQLESFFS